MGSRRSRRSRGRSASGVDVARAVAKLETEERDPARRRSSALAPAAEALERGEPAWTRATRVQVCHDLVQRGALGLHRLVAGRSRERRNTSDRRLNAPGGDRTTPASSRRRRGGFGAGRGSEATFEVVTRARDIERRPAACASASASCSFARSLAICAGAPRAAISPATPSGRRRSPRASRRPPSRRARSERPRRPEIVPDVARVGVRVSSGSRLGAGHQNGLRPPPPRASARAATRRRRRRDPSARGARLLFSRDPPHQGCLRLRARLLGSLGHLRERLVGAFQVRDERRAFLLALSAAAAALSRAARRPRAAPRPPQLLRVFRASLRVFRASLRVFRVLHRAARCSRPSPSSAGASFSSARVPGRSGARRARLGSLRALAFLRRLGAFARGRRERRSGPRSFERRVALSSRSVAATSTRRGGGRARAARLRRRRPPGLERGGRERVLRPERQGRHVRRERVLVVFRVETTRLVVRGALVATPRRAPRGRSRRGRRREDASSFAASASSASYSSSSSGSASTSARDEPRGRRRNRGTHVGNRGGVGVLRSPPGPRESPRRARRAARPRLSVSAAALAPPVVVRVRRPASSGSVVAGLALVLRGGVPGAYHHSPRRRGRGFARKAVLGGPRRRRRFPSRRGGAGRSSSPRGARARARDSRTSIVHARVALALRFARLFCACVRARTNPHYGLCPACRARRRRG